MRTPRTSEPEIDARALEASLPALTKKLQDLQAGLSEEEKAVFSSIVNSASLHLQAMRAISGTANISYTKPISAVATVGVRNALVAMPKTLGLDK
jgi:hypothetical protein